MHANTEQYGALCVSMIATHVLVLMVEYEGLDPMAAILCIYTPCIVFDIPLLVESGHWRSKLDKILVVDCSEATQVARATQRSGLSAEEVKKIIASQTSRAERLRVADVVIDNENISLEYLASEVEKIASQFGL